MAAVGIIIGVAWAAFWLYWLVSAIDSKSAGRSRRGSYVGSRVVVIAVVLLLRLRVLRGQGLQHAPWALALGLLSSAGTSSSARPGRKDT